MDSAPGLVQHSTPPVMVGRPLDSLAVAESATSRPQAEEEHLVLSAQGEPVPDEKMAPRKVLIVEDATELAEVIAATLERINVQSFHETHGGRALDVYHAERPDLVLLDIGLPDMTGWKIIDAIKGEDEAKRPIVIVITAHGDPANRLMGKLQGVHSYLIKPFTPNEVERVVGHALASRFGEKPAVEEKGTDSSAEASQPESSDALGNRDGETARS